jgi:hypothetical protein
MLRSSTNRLRRLVGLPLMAVGAGLLLAGAAPGVAWAALVFGVAAAVAAPADEPRGSASVAAGRQWPHRGIDRR